MEENQNPISHLEMDSLSITEMDINFLNETRKWTMFLSILGFIMSGLVAIFGLFAGSIFSAIPNSAFGNMPSGFGFMMGVVYLFVGVIYFFPSWYLYKYSLHLKTALQSSDSGELTAAFRNQKSFFKFCGIISLIMVGLYALIFLVSGLGMLMR